MYPAFIFAGLVLVSIVTALSMRDASRWRFVLAASLLLAFGCMVAAGAMSSYEEWSAEDAQARQTIARGEIIGSTSTHGHTRHSVTITDEAGQRQVFEVTRRSFTEWRDWDHPRTLRISAAFSVPWGLLLFGIWRFVVMLRSR